MLSKFRLSDFFIRAKDFFLFFPFVKYIMTSLLFILLSWNALVPVLSYVTAAITLSFTRLFHFFISS